MTAATGPDEVEVMAAMLTLLEPFEPDAQRRMLRWLVERLTGEPFAWLPEFEGYIDEHLRMQAEALS